MGRALADGGNSSSAQREHPHEFGEARRIGGKLVLAVKGSSAA